MIDLGAINHSYLLDLTYFGKNKLKSQNTKIFFDDFNKFQFLFETIKEFLGWLSIRYLLKV